MSQIKNNIFISLALNISQVCDKIFVIKYQKEFHKEHSSAVRRYEGRLYRPQEKREPEVCICRSERPTNSDIPLLAIDTNFKILG